MRPPALDFTGFHWQGSETRVLVIEDFQVTCKWALGRWLVTNHHNLHWIKNPDDWQDFLTWMVE